MRLLGPIAPRAPRTSPGRVSRAARSVAVALALAACGTSSPRGGDGGARDPAPERWRPDDGEFLLGGIQVREPDRARWVHRLRESGFNTVAVTVYATQEDWDSPRVRFDEAPWVVEEARAAKAAGLRVVLVLRVALDHGVERNRFLWHGMIMPRGEGDLEAWFDQYRGFVERWAAIAEELSIDVLGIGSELNALASTREVDALPELEAYYLDPAKQAERKRRAARFEGRIDPRHLHGAWQETYDSLERYLDDEIEAQRRWAEQVTGGGVADVNRRRRLLDREWNQVIAAARAIYGGTLTYAANFDQYRAVGFWPRLDAIGVNAYFPLRRHPVGALDDASLDAELEASWRRILEEISAFRAEAGAADLPVLFTELGYTSRTDATIEPWASRGFSLVGDWDEPALMVWPERKHSFSERAAAVRALGRAARAHHGGTAPLLRGLLWWKLSTVGEHQSIEPFVLLIGDDAPADPLLAELVELRELP